MIDVRNRLTERISRARLKLEVKRSVRSTLVLALGIGVGIFGAVYILSHIASARIAGAQEVDFAVDSARAVNPGLDEVRFKGIPAGRITGSKLEHGHAVITVQVKNQYGPIYRNARASLRPNSALEDMYLDITNAGTPAAGEASTDKPVPASQTRTAVNIDDVLAVFHSDTRAKLRSIMDNLGNGLHDRGAQLRTAFADAVPLLQVAGRLSHQLASRRQMTQRLVHNTGILTHALADRNTELHTLLREGSQTVKTLQAGSGDLDATLRALPPTLSAIDSSFAATRSVLGSVDTAVKRLYPIADQLPGSLAAVRRLSSSAQPAVRALQNPVRRLVPLANTLVPLSQSLRSAVSRLRPQTDTVNETTKDLANCKIGVQGFFQWDASLTKFADNRGIIPRGNLVAGPQTLGLANADERAPKGCTPGGPIGGRPPLPSDEH